MIEKRQEALTRSAFAERVGIGIEAIRFYEKKGLLKPDYRDSSNYRRYGNDAVKRARVIRSAKELGFSLNEIASLIELFEFEDNPCQTARAKTLAKIELIDRKIAELGSLKRELETLVKTCEENEPSGSCAIRERLEDAD